MALNVKLGKGLAIWFLLIWAKIISECLPGFDDKTLVSAQAEEATVECLWQLSS